MTPALPRAAVVGAGGIASVFAAQLCRLGVEVLFCSRREFATLQIESPTASFEAPVQNVVDPAAVPPEWSKVPWLLLGVKTYQTQAARPWLERLAWAGSTIVVLQNGIESRARLSNAVAGAQVVESVIYCGAELLAPGRVRHRGPIDLVLDADEQGRQVQQLFAGSAASVTLAADFVTAQWRKLMTNVAANGITALTGRRLGVLNSAGIADIVEGLLSEALTVAHAEGAALTAQDVVELVATLRAPASADVAPSMYQDRQAGRPTEHDAIYGAVVRAGSKNDIATPMHSLFAALLAAGDPPTLD
jgi:2-dehydropantoate 2-reductase